MFSERLVSNVLAMDALDVDAGDTWETPDTLLPDMLLMDGGGGGKLAEIPALSRISRIRNADHFADCVPKGARAVARSPMLAHRSAGFTRMQRRITASSSTGASGRC